MTDVERVTDGDQDELLELYVLGLLDDAEAARLERRLQKDAPARERVRELRGVIGLLPFALDPLEPSPERKGQLLDAVHADAERARVASRASDDLMPTIPRPTPTSLDTRRPARPARGLQPWLPWAVAAALALALAGSLLWSLGWSGERDTTPDVARYSLIGSGTATGAVGEVVALPEQKLAVLTLAGLSPPDLGQVFQVWFIADGPPEPSVTFLPNEHGVASVVVHADVDDFRVLAITIEPAGGSVQPTSDPILMSDLTVPAQQ